MTRSPIAPPLTGSRMLWLDTGAGPIPTGTLRSIYRQAGWDW